MIRALLVNRGSAVIIPLTSVHISNTVALTADAIMAAVKSEPPRPSVVVTPFLSVATNPGK
jgi:hypothetical protein